MHYEDKEIKMSKERLTVDEVLNEIKKHYYQVWIKCNLDTGVNVESLIKTLLEQIRDELNLERFELHNTPIQDSPYVVYESDIENVFNKYLK